MVMGGEWEGEGEGGTCEGLHMRNGLWRVPERPQGVGGRKGGGGKQS